MNEHISHEHNPSFKAYLTGFVLSLFFTVLAFYLTIQNLLSGHGLVFVILAFAIIQALVQLVFFFHMNPKTGWSLPLLVSTFGIVLIVVLGSWWIMRHLNYNMTPDQMNSTMMKMEGMK